MVNKQSNLCNSALILIGANRISSLDEDSTEAISCNQFYETSYLALLAMFPWNFAQKIEPLALLTNVVPNDQTNQFAYTVPSDMVWLQQVIPNQYSYQIVGNYIFANVNPLSAKYTYRVPEELMPILFEQTFIYYLASQICISITEDTNKQAALYAQYQDHLKRAKSVDSQQTPQDGFAYFPLDFIRYGG